MIEYNILRRADTKFVTDDKMVMTIEDNLIYRSGPRKSDGTGKIFTERCGLAVREFLYKERVKRKTRWISRDIRSRGGELVVGVQVRRIT